MHQGPPSRPITAAVNTQLINRTLTSKCCDRTGSGFVLIQRSPRGDPGGGVRGDGRGLALVSLLAVQPETPKADRAGLHQSVMSAVCLRDSEIYLSIYPERKRDTERERERLYQFQYACACLFINATTVTLESDSDLRSAWKILTSVRPRYF